MEYTWDVVEACLNAIGDQGSDALNYHKNVMMLHTEYFFILVERYVVIV